MQLLVQHGADVHNRQVTQWSTRQNTRYTIVDAAMGGHVEAVRWLLDQGMTADEVRQALVAAAKHGQAAVLHLLLEAGPDITADGPAELHTAPELQQIRTIQLIMEPGALLGDSATSETTQLTGGSVLLSTLRQALQDITLQQSAALMQAAITGGFTQLAEMLLQAVLAFHQCHPAPTSSYVG
jgi:hypothetical protein